MAYTPISGSPPQFARASDGTAANSYFLKGYVAGDTTPLAMGIDSTPTLTLARCKLNSRGEPISNDNDETTVFIPYFNAAYKLALYSSETDADNNTFGNAVWVVDNIVNFYDGTNISYTSSATITQKLNNLDVDNYTQLRALTSSQLADGDSITVTDDGIAGEFVVKTGAVTDNGGTLIVFTDDSNRYAKRNYSNFVSVKWFGALGDGSTDDTTAFTACRTFIRNQAAGYRPIMFVPAGTYAISGAFNVDDFIMKGEGSRQSMLLFDNTGSGYAMTIGGSSVNDFNKGLIQIGLADPGSNTILHGIKFTNIVQAHGFFKDVFVQQYDEATSIAFKFENCQDLTLENFSSLGGNRGLDLDSSTGVNTNLLFINYVSQNDAEWGIYATLNAEQVTFVGGVVQDVADGDCVNLDGVENFGFYGTWFETSFAAHDEIIANNVVNLTLSNAHFTSTGAECLLTGTTNASIIGTYFETQAAGTGGKLRLEDTASAVVVGCSPEINAVDSGTTVMAFGHDLTYNDLEPGNGTYHSFNSAGDIYFGTRSGTDPESATTDAQSGIKIAKEGQLQVANYQATPLIVNRIAQKGEMISLRQDGASGVGIYYGSGTPEAAITASVGSVYHRTDGGASTSFYVKESGSGNTGWVAK